MEWREREERRKNVIIKEVEVKEGKRREAVERKLGIVGTKMGIQEIKRIGREGDKEGEMILVKLRNEKQKKEVIEKKKRLRGRKESVMEDWTWKERRMRWKFEEIARVEEGKGSIPLVVCHLAVVRGPGLVAPWGSNGDFGLREGPGMRRGR